MNGKFVAYIRVSTQKQGKSGLGLEAQREAITNHLNGGSWKLVGEFKEVEQAQRPARAGEGAGLVQAAQGHFVGRQVGPPRSQRCLYLCLDGSGGQVRGCRSTHGE